MKVRRRKRRQVSRSRKRDFVFRIPPGPRSSEYWDFYRDGIHYSGFEKWLNCRHQFWLHYVRGYTSGGYFDAIEFGHVFHFLIEKWLRRGANYSRKGLRKLLARYSAEWLKDNGRQGPKARRQQEVWYSLALAMFPIYQEQFADDLSRDWVAIEREFCERWPLRNRAGATAIQDGIKAVGYPGKIPTLKQLQAVDIFGTIDTAFRRERGGRGIVLLDTKSTSYINVAEHDAALPLNLQLMLYAWALREIENETPVAVAHNIIRRTSSKPYVAKGKTPAETLEQYRKRIAADVRRRPDHYFIRLETPIDKTHLDDYLETVVSPLMRDFERWALGIGEHYPAPPHLFTKYGPCQLFYPITGNNFFGIPQRKVESRRGAIAKG